MRNLLLAPLVLVFALLAPTPASAVTISEIVSLSKAGVSEQVILALIDRDKTIFSLPAEEIVTLQKAGLSDAILIAMLKSGREQPPVVAQVEAPPPPQETEPYLVAPGRAPDQPNSGQNYGGPAAAVPYAVPYFVPVPYVVASPVAQSRCVVRMTATNGDPVTSTTGMFFKQPAHAVMDCLPAAPGPYRPARR